MNCFFFSFLCYELENQLDNTCFLYFYMQFNHVVLKLITYDILSLFCKSFFSYLIRWKPVIHVRYRDIQYRKLKTVLKARRNGRRLLQGKNVKITLFFVMNQRGLSTIVSSAHLLTKHQKCAPIHKIQCQVRSSLFSNITTKSNSQIRS